MLELLGIFFLGIILGEYEERQRHRHARTTGIQTAFIGESNMGAPSSTGTTNNGSPLFGLIQPLQANNTSSNGVVSNLSVTLSTTAFGTATVKTSVSGVQYFEFDPTAVGSTVATVTATVTDPDGTVGNFTATATINIIAGTGDILTAEIEVLFSSTVPA